MLFPLMKPFQWDKLFYTTYLVLTILAYGIVFSLFPNILVDMRYILETSMSLISLYTTVETVGYISGTFVPLFYKYLNRQLTVSLMFILLTIAAAVIPLVTQLWMLYVCAFVFGFGSGVMMCGYTVWLIEMWRARAGPWLQLCDFTFGIGSILCTVILKPFVVGELDNQNINESFTTATNQVDRRASISPPILIIGLSILPISVSSLVMFFIKRYKSEQTGHEDQHQGEEEYSERKLFDRPETPRKTIRVLFALWYTFYVIFETVFLKFAVTYFQYCPQRLTAQTAAEIFYVSTAVYTGFRGVNVLIGLKMTLFHMLSYHYAILAIGMVLLIGGQYNYYVLWTASVVLGWGFSAMFASIFAFASQYLTFTDRLGTLFTLTRGLFTLWTPLVIGLYIEHFSIIFIIIELVLLIISFIVFVAIVVLIRRHSSLLKQTEY